MAQKDYVGRSQKSNNKAKKSPRNSQTQRKGKRKKSRGSSYLILWLIVILFVIGLYWLKNHTFDKVNKPSTASPTEPESTITTPPDKRWDYVDQLVNPDNNKTKKEPPNSKINNPSLISPEQQRILSMMAADRPDETQSLTQTYNQQVDRPHQNEEKNLPATITHQRFLIQCGAFRGRERAEAVRAQLALFGFSSEITYGNNLHQVIVGSYDDRRLAEKNINQIQSNHVIDCHIKN